MRYLPVAGLLIAAALAAGCATAADPQPAVLTVAHSLGGLQCESAGSTAQALADQLRAAGVVVRSVGCGHDGRMRPAVCGAGDGRLAVLDIDADQLDRARSLGFKPLTAWPEARRLPCPSAR